VLILLAKIDKVCMWNEAQRRRTLKDIDTVVIPVKDIHGEDEFLYMITAPERMLPCYLIEYEVSDNIALVNL
jgi:hypothetical protein